MSSSDLQQQLQFVHDSHVVLGLGDGMCSVLWDTSKCEASRELKSACTVSGVCPLLLLLKQDVSNVKKPGLRG